MFDTYKFLKSHFMIWLVGFLAILIIWVGVTTLLIFLDFDAKWYAKLTMVVIGLLVALLSQSGFLMSPFLERHPSKILKLVSLISILPSLFIFIWGFSKTYQEITISNLSGWQTIFMISTGLICLVYLWQISKLFKWIIATSKSESILSIRE